LACPHSGPAPRRNEREHLADHHGVLLFTAERDVVGGLTESGVSPVSTPETNSSASVADVANSIMKR